MKITGAEPRDCPDCLTSHIGLVPCGMAYSARLRSQLVDESWMAREKKNYFDSAALEDMLIPPDAEEIMMEETKGAGYATAEEIRQAEEAGIGDLVVQHYGLDDSEVLAGG